MSRNAKPIDMIDNKKNRKTKAEIEQRAAWEEQLTSDEGMRMNSDVRADPYARELFRYLKRTFAGVGMDDALYGEGLCSYCLVKSEIRKSVREHDEIAGSDMDPETKFALLNKKDAITNKLRDIAFAWEKENLGTVQAKLRAIPKKPQKEDAGNVTGIAAFMRKQG